MFEQHFGPHLALHAQHLLLRLQFLHEDLPLALLDGLLGVLRVEGVLHLHDHVLEGLLALKLLGLLLGAGHLALQHLLLVVIRGALLGLGLQHLAAQGLQGLEVLRREPRALLLRLLLLGRSRLPLELLLPLRRGARCHLPGLALTILPENSLARLQILLLVGVDGVRAFLRLLRRFLLHALLLRQNLRGEALLGGYRQRGLRPGCLDVLGRGRR
mmetsp:Transcript_48438/g.156280  ORF Transcript_48438/g.156280 Transcript_48438/m.156280 type:complete len:215 (+) Transcript_48438:140-784(+)